MQIKIDSSLLELVEGDITKQDTEAIANAANSNLAGGGGVDGAIHRAGGPSIMDECGKIGGCPTGEARLTSGGNLLAKYVFHAVGPIYRGGTHGEPELLKNAYLSCLNLASKNAVKSVAFPSISTGVYGYPIKEAAKIALTTVIDYLKTHQEINLVRFVLFGSDAYSKYEKVLNGIGS
ncbi:MAG TPA: O-acetyl-ADP-ribose deacetylase [Nitrospinota bacterium]|jgi:O-acetyl-ADP-ribose deacetylase (regulator of RNase III)|nr:O-acetyl-ADP-ribose deacetylase [Nitrospinota bacterium]